jgi:tetratricopeptide (TPR) repeat protein
LIQVRVDVCSLDPTGRLVGFSLPGTSRIGTCCMWNKLFTRRSLNLIAAAGAVGFGAAGWLLLSPLWAIAGVVAGPFLALVVFSVVVTFTLPDATTLVNQHEPYQALKQVRHDIRTSRYLAKIWPSQWRDALALNLITQSEALHALSQDAHALRSCDEAVTIYQALAAENPGKYGPDLADALDRQSRLLATAGRQADAIAAVETAVRLYRNLAIAEASKYLPALAEALTCMASWLTDIRQDSQALAAAHEATGIYWHRLPWPDLPPCAAQAALLEGQLLSRKDRHHDAATMLARGWHLAVSQHQQNALSAATPALKATYDADPDDFATVWHTETGAKPPDWLAR